MVISGAGVSTARLDALSARAERDVAAGLLPSCQLAVALDGAILHAETFGAAGPLTRYVTFSVTKGVVAGAVWLLVGEGVLDPDVRVAEIVPEFGTHGKEAVTVEQLLVHTAGFPRARLGLGEAHSRQVRLDAFASWRLEWEPGTASEYHPTSAHWVLAEVVERVTGETLADLVRARLAQPLGLESFELGVPPERQSDVASLAIVGEPASPDELEAVLGVRRVDVGEATDEALLWHNDTAVRALGLPGGGLVAGAADLALYYQALLHNEGGLWRPDVLHDGTARVRHHFVDRLLRMRANRTLGLVVAGDDGLAGARGFGHGVSPRAFGHPGAGGQVAWADPETGISFAYLTNGVDAHVLRRDRRAVALSSIAATLTSKEAR